MRKLRPPRVQLGGAGPESLCASCRLTRVIPDQSVPGHPQAWFALENAKRRLVYTLHALRLPTRSKDEDAAAAWRSSSSRTRPTSPS